MSIIEELAKMSISQYEFFVDEVFEDEQKHLNEKECNKLLHNKYQIRLNKNGVKLYKLYKENLTLEKQIRTLNSNLKSRNKDYAELALQIKKYSLARNLAI